MLTWGARRQLTVLLVLGIFALLLLVGVYFLFLKPGASCFDGVKNQEEVGVDCGGGCTRVCESEVSPLITFWTRVFKISPGVYDVGAFLENPNVGFGITELRYTIRAYDKENTLIAERPGVAFVNQRERFLIFESRIPTGNLVPVRATLELQDFEWTRLPATASRATGLVVENKQIDITTSPRITAELVNTSAGPLSNIEVAVVVYDGAQNVLGVSGTHVDELARGARTPIGFTWPESFAGTPISSEIFPRINAVTP